MIRLVDTFDGDIVTMTVMVGRDEQHLIEAGKLRLSMSDWVSFELALIIGAKNCLVNLAVIFPDGEETKTAYLEGCTKGAETLARLRADRYIELEDV